MGVKSSITFQDIRCHVCENEDGEEVRDIVFLTVLVITIFFNRKFMGVGPDGAYGQLVPNPVDLEHKRDHEVARNRRLNMAGKCVQER